MGQAFIDVREKTEVSGNFAYINYRPLGYKKGDIIKIVKRPLKDDIYFFMEVVKDEFRQELPQESPHNISVDNMLKSMGHPYYNSYFVFDDDYNVVYITLMQTLSKYEDYIICPECHCILDPNRLIKERHYDSEEYYMCPNACCANFSDDGNYSHTYSLLKDAFKKIKKEEIQKKHTLLDNFMVVK